MEMFGIVILALVALAFFKRPVKRVAKHADKILAVNMLEDDVDLTTRANQAKQDLIERNGEDFETVDDFKADILKTLQEKKAESAKHEKEEKAIEKLVELSTVELPEPMIQYQQQKMLDNFGQQLMYQGMNLDQYLNMTGQSRDDMLDQVRPEAEKQIRRSLIVEAVAEKQGFEVTDEDKEAEMQRLADQYQMELDKIKEIMGDDQMDALANDIKMQKAVAYIAEQAKEV